MITNKVVVVVAVMTVINLLQTSPNSSQHPCEVELNGPLVEMPIHANSGLMLT